MGLASIAAHRLGGIVAVGSIFKASIKIGEARARFRKKFGKKHQAGALLPILQMKEGGSGGMEQRVK